MDASRLERSFPYGLSESPGRVLSCRTPRGVVAVHPLGGELSPVLCLGHYIAFSLINNHSFSKNDLDLHTGYSGVGNPTLFTL